MTRLTPSPPVAAAEAADAVRACFGLAGEFSRLPGEADDNFLLRVPGGLGPAAGGQDNTLISADGHRVSGIIDFGDVTVTALVNDVAIAVANLLADDADPFGPALDFIAGYHATTPLTTTELNLLPDLILGRVVARIIISEWRAERFPENRAYVLRNTPRAWEHLHRLLSIASEQTAARIQEATRA